MMKKLLLFSGLIMAFFVTSQAQDCTAYFPAEEGTVVELEQFDSKGKLTGSSEQKLLSKEESGNSVKWTVQNTVKDNKGEAIMESELTFECRDGVFYFDMDNLLGGESMAAFKEMDFRIEGDNLEYPPSMKAGDVLKDGQIRMIIEQMPAMSSTTSIINRTVEAIEDVETDAGTFKCYKISYDMETKALMTFRISGVEWIAENIGVIKSETYNKKGKLTGYSLLSRLEK
jgi:hypothetical protein